jgi:hypothetical protein
MYINITVTIVDDIYRPVFYLKRTMDHVRTSQEAHYDSTTSPTVTIVNAIYRPVFYLKRTMDHVRTSQEAHCNSTTSPTV